MKQPLSSFWKGGKRKYKEADMRKRPELKDVIDQFFVVQQEMIPGKGEDSYLLEVKEKEAAAGVFDGCGGSGARTYEYFENHTGAYIASRTLAYAAHCWFKEQYADPEKRKKDPAKELKRHLDQFLQNLMKSGRASRGLRGSIMKDFPSTLALATVSARRGRAEIGCCWCGDSRGFVLDREGLHQITRDDTLEPDAMKNLTECAPMNNLVSASAAYEIHRSSFLWKLPCVVLTATDGCFDMLESPMEFEKLLLRTLCHSQSTEQWKERLHQELKKTAADDYSMSVLIVGFGSFLSLRNCFQDRLSYMMKEFPLSEKTSREELWEQWNFYRENYEKYQKESDGDADRRI